MIHHMLLPFNKEQQTFALCCNKIPVYTREKWSEHTEHAFSSEWGLNIRAWPSSLLLSQQHPEPRAQSAGTLLSFVYFCLFPAQFKEKNGFLFETLPDGYLCSCEAVKRTFDIFFRLHRRTLTHTQAHKHTFPLWTPEETITGLLQDKWTHTCTHYPQRCSAVPPHQWRADLRGWPCNLGEMAQRSWLK